VCARRSSSAKRWWPTRSTSAAGAVSASSASDAAPTATYLLVRSVWAACAQSATPPFSSPTCSERGCFPPFESTASRESAWTCRSARAELGKPLRGLPHGPHRVATTMASPSTFSIQIPRRKTAGVYHDNHPNAAADAGLRGLLLSRLNRVRWPTFIPALTRGKQTVCRLDSIA